MIVYVGCGMFVGLPRWRIVGDWVYESGECSWEGEIEVTEEEWEDGLDFHCPECGALLEDSSHFLVGPNDPRNVP